MDLPPTADRRPPTGLRTLAIDLGTKRVGLAMSDAGGRFASPFDRIDVTAMARAVAPVLAVIEREGVERVVIGLPLNMDGTAGPAAREAIAWADGVRAANVKIVFVDERLSSFDAEQRLIDRKRGGEKITRGDRKKQLDALAATVFLQEFLDGAIPEIDVDRLDD